jgi:hypothetical protein
VNYAKVLEMNSFFTWHTFLEVGKTQDLPSKIWQTLGGALSAIEKLPSAHMLNGIKRITQQKIFTKKERRSSTHA